MRNCLLCLMLYAFLIVPSPLGAQNDDANHIVFENLSGRAALVKLVGTSSQTVSVPNGERRAIAVEPGEYFFVVRYGSAAGQYSYRKSAMFSVAPRPGTVAEMAITLHMVPGGNFSTKRATASEFDAVASSGPRNSGDSSPQAIGASPGQDGDRAYWQEINKSDAAELELYLQKYPNGEYAGLARVRLKGLNGVSNPRGRPAAQKEDDSTHTTDLTGKSLCRLSAFRRPDPDDRLSFLSGGLLTYSRSGYETTQGTWRQTGESVYAEYPVIVNRCANRDCSRSVWDSTPVLKRSGDVRKSEDGGLSLTLRGGLFDDRSPAHDDDFTTACDPNPSSTDCAYSACQYLHPN
jgi:hypothetical protein